MEKSSISIKETAELAGITVRTLQYYDKIGLLKPAFIEQNGYRKYDEKSFKKLQQIMFLRELDFTLAEIKEIMQSEKYDETEMLLKQKELLRLKRDRLSGLIELIDKTIGGDIVSLKEFDMSYIERQRNEYAQEARQKWGSTKAYKQSQERTKKYSQKDWQMINEEAEKIYLGFAKCMRGEGSAETTDELSQRWQQHITKYYYDCTDEILLGLADMYVQDLRFKENIDQYSAGLAEFMSVSINKYLENKKLK